MKKIAIFLLDLQGGGAERIVSYIIDKGYRKFEFHLILLKRKIDYSLPQADNVKIMELGGGGYSKFLGVLKIPLLARRLKKYLTDNKIEVVFSLLDRPNLIACRAKKSGWNGRLIISERADTIAYYKTVRFGHFMIELVKKYYRNADVVTVISKGIAQSLRMLGIENCKVIYNPINIHEKHRSERPANSPFTFINIARLDYQKNQELLLKAFARIGDHDCRLIILGKGKLLGRLQRLVARLKIKDKVSFAGFQSDVRLWLKGSDCLVLSSDYEGFGNVITEALSTGVAVISTDCPHGPREILAPETDINTSIKDHIEMAQYGILTPVNSVTHMADAMRRIMTDTELKNKYCRLGPERAIDFDINKIVEQYFDLF